MAGDTEHKLMRKLIVSIHSTANDIVTGPPSDETNFMVWAQAGIEDSLEPFFKSLANVGRATSTGDPTLHGGTLIVANSARSNERVRVDLPAAGWRLLGTSLAPKGSKFRDASPTAPIATVVVKTDALSVKGNGARMDKHAPRGAAGPRRGRVRLGDVAWCADAAARTSGTPPSSTRFDHVDKFDGQPSAPPPPVCPIYDTP